MNGREKAEGAGGRRKARYKATAPVVAVSHCLHIVLGGLEPCRYGGDSAKAPEIAGFLPILAAPIFMFRACAHERCFSITRGADHAQPQIGRESCRDRVCQSVWVSVVAVSLKKKK